MSIPKGTPMYDLPETNRIRAKIEWVRAALTTYAQQSGRLAIYTDEDRQDPDVFFRELVSDFIGDLGHLAQFSGITIRPLLAKGLEYYDEESAEVMTEQLTEHSVRDLSRDIEHFEQNGEFRADAADREDGEK